MAGKQQTVTLHGKPVTIVGTPVKVGNPVPDFSVVDQDLNTVTRSVLAGSPCILSSVVSLDTPVCDIQMRRFNSEAASLGKNVRILVVSMDLPFAQKRWCGAAGATNVKALSDHRDASFGKAFGVLIRDLRLLARAVFLVDARGVLRYCEVVPEVTHEPDYQAVLKALRELP